MFCSLRAPHAVNEPIRLCLGLKRLCLFLKKEPGNRRGGTGWLEGVARVRSTVENSMLPPVCAVEKDVDSF